MNILVLNGSPKKSHSNTLKLTNAFVKGVSEETNATTEQLDIAQLNIGACKGCFACWKATPGECCINDDMPKVIEKILWADFIIYSFPLYYFNVPGALKNMIDRQLPMVLPFMSERADGIGSGSHDTRYDMSQKKYVLISTCGFYSADKNYDSVLSMFDHICGKSKYDTIFCGQGELFSIKELSNRTDEYLSTVKKAGAEYAKGEISDDTKAQLQTLLLPKETFEKMADASWGVSRESGKKEDESLIFTRQMAALYNKNSFDGKDRVLEITYTYINKTYQIKLGKDGSEVFDEPKMKYTTKIETPFDVWVSIAQGEIRGDEALMKKMYKVDGDFSLMINWDKFFGQDAEKPTQKAKSTKQKPPKMITMLLPWIVFWSAVSIDTKIGALVTLCICGMLSLIFAKTEFSFYDKITAATVSLLSVGTILTDKSILFMNIGYLVFGLTWLLSCLTKEPLCAAYVKFNYGGDEALKNPIFMKTNYILAAAWGVLYVLIAIGSFLLTNTFFADYSQIIIYVLTGVMGIFTVWFEKWYPAKVARGK